MTAGRGRSSGSSSVQCSCSPRDSDGRSPEERDGITPIRGRKKKTPLHLKIGTKKTVKLNTDNQPTLKRHKHDSNPHLTDNDPIFVVVVDDFNRLHPIFVQYFIYFSKTVQLSMLAKYLLTFWKSLAVHLHLAQSKMAATTK